MDITTLFMIFNTLMLLLLGAAVVTLLLRVFRRPPKQ